MDQPMTFCQIILHKKWVDRTVEIFKEQGGSDDIRAPSDPIPIPINEPPPNVCREARVRRGRGVKGVCEKRVSIEGESVEGEGEGE